MKLEKVLLWFKRNIDSVVKIAAEHSVKLFLNNGTTTLRYRLNCNFHIGNPVSFQRLRLYLQKMRVSDSGFHFSYSRGGHRVAVVGMAACDSRRNGHRKQQRENDNHETEVGVFYFNVFKNLRICRHIDYCFITLRIHSTMNSLSLIW